MDNRNLFCSSAALLVQNEAQAGFFGEKHCAKYSLPHWITYFLSVVDESSRSSACTEVILAPLRSIDYRQAIVQFPCSNDSKPSYNFDSAYEPR